MRKFFVIGLLLSVVSLLDAGTFVGVGGNGPINILIPNTVAWRFGKNVSGKNVMVEPSISFNFAKTTNRTPGDSSDVTDFGLGFDLLAIYPFFKVSDFDVHALVGFGFGFNNSKTTQRFTANDGDYFKSSTLGFGVDYGVGMQVYLTKTFSVGVDAISGIVYSKTSQEQKIGNTTTDLGSVSTFGLSLDNTVFRFMLFFGR